MKTKISARDAVAVLSEVPGTLLKLASERDALQTENTALKEELEALKTQQRIDKIASDMASMGLVDKDTSPEDLRQRLIEKSAAGKLDAVAEAVDLYAHGNPLGFVESGAETSGSGSAAAAAFESAILGQ